MQEPFNYLEPLKQYVVALSILMWMYGCDSPDPQIDTSTEVVKNQLDLLNPETCQPCHPTHYEQWKASMHEYTRICLRAYNYACIRAHMQTCNYAQVNT